MDASLEIAAQLAEHHEGLRLKPYHDPVGYPTVGYGHLLSKEAFAPLSKWPAITLDIAKRWLRDDLAVAAAAVDRLITVPLNDNQRAALIDFTFNAGAGNLQTSALRRRLNQGFYDEVPYQLSRWVYAKSVRLPGLVRRRKEEGELFLA